MRRRRPEAGAAQQRLPASPQRRVAALRLALAVALGAAAVGTAAHSRSDTATDSMPEEHMARPEHQAGAAPTAEELIRALALDSHVEGGYFRRTYEATGKPRIDEGRGERFSMTSIFYLLTAAGPVGHFHRNRSDIVHYFHLGDPIEYFLIHPDGTLEAVTMGPDPTRGHRLQLTVASGIWKASRLTGGPHGYGLISEAVTPGFDYADMTLGVTSELVERFPAHTELIRALSRESTPPQE